ncbi:MAG: hypothetical protein J5J06_19075 [Phycisphaerae bacterium]|nr:hypothetical protein [Phycisphaerae bacterium]
MPRFYITVHPWDLVDEGIDPVLDRLRGEIGVSGVTLSMGVSPMTQLRRRAIAPRVMRSQGGLLFSPREEFYETTRLRPGVSTALRRKVTPVEMAERCLERSLAVRASIHATTLGRVLSKYPDAGCRNALDDRSALSLCPANPDVQALLSGLVADVGSQWPCDGIVLHDFRMCWAEADQPGALGGGNPDPTIRTLLGQCFCESCLRSAGEAGVDALSARRLVQTLIDKVWQSPGKPVPPFQELVAGYEILHGMEAWRTQALGTLAEKLASAASCPLVFVVNERNANPPGVEANGAFRAVSSLHGGEEPKGEADPGEELMLEDDYAMQVVSADVVAVVQRATRAGYAAIHLGNWGSLSDAALTGIKQAIRYARRSPGDSSLPHR